MTTNKKDQNVFDALIRSAENLTDEQVESEYREDGEGLDEVAGRVRGTLLAAVAEHQGRERDRIRRERSKSLNELGVFRSQLPSTPERRRQRLRRALRQNPEARTEVTAQFRNLDEMTDKDVESALTQLAFLGLLNEEAE